MVNRGLLENSSRIHVQPLPAASVRVVARLVPIAFARNVLATISALALLLGIIQICSSTAIAQEKDSDKATSGLKDLSLEQLMDVNIYTASKRWQKLVDAPASISIVTADEIQKYGYRTLAEILSSIRGVYIGYDRNYSYIGMRGFSRPGDYNTRVLLLVDGHRINDNVFDQAYLGYEFPIDVDLIERVEFIRGPSSSLYGGSAFFGVINVITKRGRDNRGVSASIEAGSFNSYKGRLSYSADFKNGMEMLLSTSFYDSRGQRLFYKEFDTPETNNGFADNSDYERSHSFLANLSYRDFHLQAVNSSRKKGVPTAAFDAVFNDSRTRTIDGSEYVDLQYQHNFSNGLDVTGQLSYDRYNYDGTFVVDYAGTGIPPYVENKDVARGRWWGLGLNASKNLGRHKVTAGNEYRYNSRQDQENYDSDPYFSYLNDKRGSTIWALYAVDEFRIRDNLIVNAGLRYDHYDTFGGTANPRLALIYKPDEHGSLKLLYGQAFRAPNSFELFYQASVTTKPNPFLEPETIRTTELVFERYAKHFRFVVSAFYNDINGLITQVVDPADGKIQFSNLENVNGKGVETSVEARLPNGIEGRVSYTMQNSLSERTKDSLSNSPSHVAKMRFSVPLARRKVFASFQGLYTSERRTLADTNLSGSFVSNATVFGKSLFKGCDVSAGVYNLFNVHYANPGGEEHVQESITQDGRSYRLKLTYSFNRGK